MNGRHLNLSEVAACTRPTSSQTLLAPSASVDSPHTTIIPQSQQKIFLRELFLLPPQREGAWGPRLPISLL